MEGVGRVVDAEIWGTGYGVHSDKSLSGTD